MRFWPTPQYDTKEHFCELRLCALCVREPRIIGILCSTGLREVEHQFWATIEKCQRLLWSILRWQLNSLLNAKTQRWIYSNSVLIRMFFFVQVYLQCINNRNDTLLVNIWMIKIPQNFAFTTVFRKGSIWPNRILLWLYLRTSISYSYALCTVHYAPRFRKNRNP